MKPACKAWSLSKKKHLFVLASKGNPLIVVCLYSHKRKKIFILMKQLDVEVSTPATVSTLATCKLSTAVTQTCNLQTPIFTNLLEKFIRFLCIRHWSHITTFGLTSPYSYSNNSKADARSGNVLNTLCKMEENNIFDMLPLTSDLDV